MDVSGCLIIPLPEPPPGGHSNAAGEQMPGHITLLYLKKQPLDQIYTAIALAHQLASTWPQTLYGKYGGNAITFDGDTPVHVYPVFDHNLQMFRDVLIEACEEAGVNTTQDHPEYQPHLTHAYGGEPPPPKPIQGFDTSHLEFWTGKNEWVYVNLKYHQKAAKPDHRYISRRPAPGGGWIYTYPGDGKRDTGSAEETTAAGRRKQKADKEKTVRDQKRQSGSANRGEKTKEAGETIDIELVSNLSRGQLRAHIMESSKETYDEDGVVVPKEAHRPDELLGVKKFVNRRIAQIFAQTIKGSKVQMTVFPTSPFSFFYLALDGKPVNPDSSPANPFLGVGMDEERKDEPGVQV